MTRRRRSPGVIYSICTDLVAVIIFAALGRGAHGEGMSPAAYWQTVWPFVVGMVLGWLVLRMWRNPVHWVRTAGLVAIAVTVGQLLRVFVVGDSTHWTFVVVSVLALAVLMFGWRLVHQFVQPRLADNQG